MEKYYKFCFLALITAMAGDLIFSFILSFFYSSYSNLKMSISALGNPQSPVRIPFNIWMTVEGLLFLLSLPALYNYFHKTSSGITNTMLAFIAAFAIGACIFTSFFSVNESREIVTLSSKIHGAASVIGFMLFLFVPLLLAILFFKGGENAFAIISLISFIISLIFFALFVMSDKTEFSGSLIDNEGLWQRLNLLFMYLPLGILAVKYLRH